MRVADAFRTDSYVQVGVVNATRSTSALTPTASRPTTCWLCRPISASEFLRSSGYVLTTSSSGAGVGREYANVRARRSPSAGRQLGHTRTRPPDVMIPSFVRAASRARPETHWSRIPRGGGRRSERDRQTSRSQFSGLHLRPLWPPLTRGRQAGRCQARATAFVGAHVVTDQVRNHHARTQIADHPFWPFECFFLRCLIRYIGTPMTIRTRIIGSAPPDPMDDPAEGCVVVDVAAARTSARFPITWSFLPWPVCGFDVASAWHA